MSTLQIREWAALDEDARDALLSRPQPRDRAARRAEVMRLIDQVRIDGDHTLRLLTRRFDGVELERLTVTEAEFEEALVEIPADLAAAIREAIARVRLFHAETAPKPQVVETAPGVICERVYRGLDTVGLYVPAGSAPLPSTAIMLGVPAQLAGVARVVLCSPPNKSGKVDPTVLFVARELGIHLVCKLGGVQAIAAMAYGTESVPKCAKIFGPGNSYVTEAKLVVAADLDGAAIDMPAGPSEVLVVADRGANAAFVAADLLSQAEHGPDSQVMLLSPCPDLLRAVSIEVDKQVAQLPRADVALQALNNSRAILVDSLTEAVALSNRYAPEHLILAVRDPQALLPLVRHAGSVFLGDYAPESVGDYCSGTNHVLPTAGMARAYSGVSVLSFQTAITVQQLTRDGLAAIGPCAIRLAEAEGLHAHANAVRVRLEAL